jgi:hypothetical protein
MNLPNYVGVDSGSLARRSIEFIAPRVDTLKPGAAGILR